jgi:hypothetical protein
MRISYRVPLLASLIFALGAAQAIAASPRLQLIQPWGGQRGTELEVVLVGSNLEDAEEVMLYDPGVEVLGMELVTDKEGKSDGRRLKVKFKIADNCPLGTQRIRVRTRTGLSDLTTFHVGALPSLDEKEPNTDFEQPQAIEKNVIVNGRIDREDVDYFVIEAKKGERISAEIFGMRLGLSSGGDFFDPYVAILNEQRFELIKNDDTPLGFNDAVVSLIAPEDGKYIIQVRDTSYNGDGRAYYRLHVGNFPRPTAVIPAGGKPGETLAVTFLGDAAGPFTRETTLPSESQERFGLIAEDEHGLAPSQNWFRLSDLPNSIEAEPNNSRADGEAVDVPAAFNGVLSEGDEWDFFKFRAKKGQVFDVETYARRIRSPLDPVTYVYNVKTGAQVGANDDSRGSDSYFRVEIPEDGEYAVGIRDHLKQGSDVHTYRVEVTPVEPKLLARPIEFRRYVQPQIIIPQGGGVGVQVNVTRTDIGGPVNFRGENLPAGVRIECPEGWRGGGTMPVVFYASDDAPLAGTYSNLICHLDDPNQPDKKVEGPLAQLNLMIRGQNNNRVWEEEELRMPVIVTEKAPFKVRIEEPPVPLVRGGSMTLKVIAEKAEGFDEEIAVQVLQNPPGVNSSISVKIPKGQTEALIPINAAGNAAIATTPIAVRASATVGNGTVETCTPFVPLRVEEMYLKFEFQAAAANQGTEARLIIKVTKQKDFEGEATVKLVGLPAKATAEDLTLTKDTQELVFTINTAADTPNGQHKNLICQVQVPEAGTTIHHTIGTGRLSVNPPPPEKKETPQPKAEEVAKKEPPAKPLSRLEQLRKAQEEREAAAASSGGGE